jgi:hypothetical protein
MPLDDDIESTLLARQACGHERRFVQVGQRGVSQRLSH